MEYFVEFATARYHEFREWVYADKLVNCEDLKEAFLDRESAKTSSASVTSTEENEGDEEDKEEDAPKPQPLSLVRVEGKGQLLLHARARTPAPYNRRRKWQQARREPHCGKAAPERRA